MSLSNGAGGGTRTHKPFGALVPKTSVFANFTTPAHLPRLFTRAYRMIIEYFTHKLNTKPKADASL